MSRLQATRLWAVGNHYRADWATGLGRNAFLAAWAKGGLSEVKELARHLPDEIRKSCEEIATIAIKTDVVVCSIVLRREVVYVAPDGGVCFNRCREGMLWNIAWALSSGSEISVQTAPGKVSPQEAARSLGPLRSILDEENPTGAVSTFACKALAAGIERFSAKDVEQSTWHKVYPAPPASK